MRIETVAEFDHAGSGVIQVPSEFNAHVINPDSIDHTMRWVFVLLRV